jgi:phospholipid/cholesterol/gamma-HCH transport system permease protein
VSEERTSRSPAAVFADGVEQTGYMLVLLAQAGAALLKPRQPRRTIARFMDQLYTQTVKSLLVVAIVGVFTGMVLSLQIGEELRRYGQEEVLGKVVAATLAREMGPFITAIILAATVGGAIAAELGTMRVSDEIDALELMNIDPVRFLVTPRVAALTLTALVLTIFVDGIGVLGGAVVANSHFGVRYADYFAAARETLSGATLFGVLPKDIYSGLTKACVFGLLIGALGCGSGLTAKGGALGVGRAVRTAVVASIVVILIVGYVLTWVFWVLVE